MGLWARDRVGRRVVRHRVGQCLATAHSLCRTFAPRRRRTVTLINDYSEDRTAKYRDGPITQGSRIQVAVLLRQPDNEPRNSRTFYFVAADLKDFCRGRERVAQYRQHFRRKNNSMLRVAPDRHLSCSRYASPLRDQWMMVMLRRRVEPLQNSNLIGGQPVGYLLVAEPSAAFVVHCRSPGDWVITGVTP
jgi:hypothetical protein